jgi:tight adherence protein B
MLSELYNYKDLPLLILICFIFLSVFFFIRGIVLYLADPKRQHQRHLQSRLKEMEGLDATPNASTLLKKANLNKSVLDLLIEKLHIFNQLQILMLQADLNWRPESFLAVMFVCGVVAAGASAVKGGIWGALAGFALGGYIPYKLLVFRRKRRFSKFERQLPDALDLLSRGLRAGHTFPAGLQQIAREMPDPLGTEFSKTFREFSHGMDLNSALLSLGERVKIRDLSFFTTAVLIQRETGGNLTEILEKISVLIRERFKLRNQVRALTAEGRLSGLILILMPPVLAGILMALNPEYESQLFTHPLGRMMCGAGLGFQLLGMLIIRKIVNIKV